MNAIAGLSVDVPSEPRGESPTPGVIGAADSAEFGLALAMAAAAQSPPPAAPPVAPVPAPVPLVAGDAGDLPATELVPALAGEPADAPAPGRWPVPLASVPRPAPLAGPVRPPLPPATERSVAIDRAETAPPAAPAPPATRAPLPSPAANAVAAAEFEGEPPVVPARPVPDIAPAAPLAPPANPEAPQAARVAPLPAADLPLTIRVLELVRGMTERAARTALDTALSAGSPQGAALEGAPPEDRSWSAPWQSREASRQVVATRALEALPGPGGPDRGRSAARNAPRPAPEAVAPGRDAAQGRDAVQDEAVQARTALPPRTAVPAAAPAPVPRSGPAPPPVVLAQAMPAPAPAVGEPGRDRPHPAARDGEGRTRAAGAMLADASAAARAARPDESVPATAGPGSPALPEVRPSAVSVASPAGPARAAATAPETHTPARLGDQVTLHFSGEDGLEGRLRVAVRGPNVRATILADDPVAAERFSRGLDGLQRALLDRGFSDARLSVQQTARSEGSAPGNLPRDGGQGDAPPRGEGRDRQSPSRQERHSASPEERPDRRPSRQRTER